VRRECGACGVRTHFAEIGRREGMSR
jgi:hypothetical protein